MSGRPAAMVVRSCGPLRGEARPVRDKSITHRALIFAALAGGRSWVREANLGEDCRSTADAVGMLGAEMREIEGGWEVVGAEGRFRDPAGVLDLRNSGTGIRLLSGCIAGRGVFAVLTGDASLLRRPMRRIAEPLERMGAVVMLRGGEYPPIAIRGASPMPIRYEAPVASAQVKSAVLLAATGLLEGEAEVREPALSRDHTERFMEWLGLPIARDGTRSVLRGPVGSIRSFEIAVPVDPSSAAFYAVAASITPGSDLWIDGLLLNPTRTGFLDVLAAMGAEIEVAEAPAAGPEPVGRVRIRSSRLRGTTIAGDLLVRCIDEIPILAVAAAAAEGVTEIRDARELRVKESDRLATSGDMARALGAEVELGEDRLTIRGSGGMAGGAVRTHGDHRIAMSAIVAGCAARGHVTVDDASPIPTSDPGFVSEMRRLGANLG